MTIEYDGVSYILLDGAMLVNWHNTARWEAPAIKSKDEPGIFDSIPVYTVIWDVVEPTQYQIENEISMTDMVDWDKPDDVCSAACAYSVLDKRMY